MTAILDWLNEYESALSAIAALIVIGTVAATMGRNWLVKNRNSGNSKVHPGAASTGAHQPNPVTDRPSIAVLPFENTSGDPAKEAAADGLTTEIIAGLSANRHLFVIARNSCFTYKGRSVDVREVSRELGVRYVLEGTVRIRDDRVRVSAQLIDATNGATTWSQRFDVPIEDLFELDDIVTADIVAALIPELRRAEAARARENPVGLDIWSRVNSAWLDLQNDLANQANARDVIQRLEAILKEAPEFALAHGVLAHAYSLAFQLGDEEAKSTQDLKAKTTEHLQQAITLDPDDPAIRHLAGAALSNYRESEEARRSYQKALDLNPDYAPALGSLGVSLVYAGRTQEAIEHIERALRLSPREPQAYHWQSHLALAHNVLGNPALALDYAKTAYERRPTMMGRVSLIMANALLGNTAEATVYANELKSVMSSTMTRASYTELLNQLVEDEDRYRELRDAIEPYLNDEYEDAEQTKA
ncbi:tetratricopeptide repeat protein [Pyruvatibacter sp.]|uniref:tetratricopeptide repeat protein n=1 Tax=Pyruvatibacter sp. TaxID=1981328 RepID=UPI00326539F5